MDLKCQLESSGKSIKNKVPLCRAAQLIGNKNKIMTWLNAIIKTTPVKKREDLKGFQRFSSKIKA